MAKPGKLQTVLEYALARIDPLRPGQFAALVLAIAVGLVDWPTWLITCRAICDVPDSATWRLLFRKCSENERRQLLRGSFASLGRLLGEFSQLPQATPESLRKIIEYDEVGLAHLREAEKNKRGVIFLTGHLGVWELHSFGWSALEYPLSFLVRPLDNPRIEEMIEGSRTQVWQSRDR